MSDSPKYNYTPEMFFVGDYLDIAKAIRNEKSDQVYLLVNESKIDVNRPGKEGTTLLAWAVLMESVNCIKTLVQLGANPNQLIDDGKQKFNLIALVAGGKNDETIVALLDSGADPNGVYKNEPAIFRTIFERRWDRMRLFLDRGADINKQSNADISPILLCAMLNQYEQVAYLIERGADFSKPSLSKGTVALEVQEFQLDTTTINGQWRNRVKKILEDRGVVFPVPRPWEH